MRDEVHLIYASSAALYGAGREFREARECESPINVYGYSKFLFDQLVRRRFEERTAQIAGLRYFNVYGEREQHKGRMASVAWHFFNQYRGTGHVRLFSGSGGYADGEQRRDFVSVEDCVKVNLFLLDHPGRSGIFNVGTGAAQSFNEVAVATVNACRRRAQRGAPFARRPARAGRDPVHPVPGGPEGPLPELYPGGYRGAAQRGLRCPVPERGRGRVPLLRAAPAGAGPDAGYILDIVTGSKARRGHRVSLTPAGAEPGRLTHHGHAPRHRFQDAGGLRRQHAARAIEAHDGREHEHAARQAGRQQPGGLGQGPPGVLDDPARRRSAARSGPATH